MITLHFTCNWQSIASNSLYYLRCDRGGFVFECRAAGRCMIVFVFALLGFILVQHWPSSSSRVLSCIANQYSFGLVLGLVHFFGLQCSSIALVRWNCLGVLGCLHFHVGVVGRAWCSTLHALFHGLQ